MVVHQILFFCLMSSWTNVESKPFGEFGIKNDFGLEFKPIEFKPIAFFKEVFSPFGKWGMKHGIEKRDLDTIKPLDMKDLPKLDMKKLPPLEVTHMPLLNEMSRLPAEVYEPSQEHVTMPPPFLRAPFVPQYPISAPPHPPVLITPPPPKFNINEVEEQEEEHKLHTDIYKEELINAYLKGVESEEKVLPPVTNSIGSFPVEKPKEEVPAPPEENPIVRGSKLALYFGNILLDVIAQFFGKPRAPGETLFQQQQRLT